MKYRVFGTAIVNVSVIVEANDEEAAIEIACEELAELSSYCGNGGTDKLVGVRGENESVSSDGPIDWDSAEPADGE